MKLRHNVCRDVAAWNDRGLLFSRIVKVTIPVCVKEGVESGVFTGPVLHQLACDKSEVEVGMVCAKGTEDKVLPGQGSQ